MKNIIDWIKDWYEFGKYQGLWFSFKYKTGIARQGKDFF